MRRKKRRDTDDLAFFRLIYYEMYTEKVTRDVIRNLFMGRGSW